MGQSEWVECKWAETQWAKIQWAEMHWAQIQWTRDIINFLGCLKIHGKREYDKGFKQKTIIGKKTLANVKKYVLKLLFFAVFNRAYENKPEENVLKWLFFDSKSASTISESAT